MACRPKLGTSIPCHDRIKTKQGSSGERSRKRIDFTKRSKVPKPAPTMECTARDGSRLRVDWTSTAIFALVRTGIQPVQSLMTYKTRNTDLARHCRHLGMTARVSSGILMHLGVFMISIRICFSGLLLTDHGRLVSMLGLMDFGIIRGFSIRVHR